MRLWDLKSKLSVKKFTSPELKKASQVANCLFGPDNSILVAGDKNVRIFREYDRKINISYLIDI